MEVKWVVQRFEPRLDPYEQPVRKPLREVGYPKVCEDWREACEAVTLAIGDNRLKFGEEAGAPVVLVRNDTTIVVYMKLVVE